MTRRRPDPAVVRAEAVALFAEIGWVGGVDQALRLRGWTVSRPALGRWLREAGFNLSVVRVSHRTKAVPPPWRMLSQEEFDALHAPWPVPTCRLIEWPAAS